MGYRVFPGVKERPGRDADPSPPSSAVGHERVELYLYFPYGPYGLYRASVPVQGCTIPAKKSALLQLINYQICSFFFSLELKNHILDTNSHFTPELLTFWHQSFTYKF